ncbi:MAG: CDP-diacylglycerol--serine O-phosphatidyltransferase [Thermodesulfobacteriota bacterium]
MQAKRKKSKRQRMIPVLPNLFTTGNLFCGLLSIMTSIEVITAVSAGGAPEEWVFRRFWWACAFIVISAFLDMMDGKLARFFNHESKFGLSYDSLSDLVSFGVAPAVLVYTWVLMGSGKIGLMAVLFYVVCAALRLARFNVQSGDEEKFNFTGLPSPAAAGLMIAPVMLLTALNIVPDIRAVWFFLIAAPVIGLLMVSNVSYSKRPYFNLGGPFNALVVAAIIFAAIITHPEIMFIIIVYLYAFIGLALYAVKQLKGRPKLSEDAETSDSGS